jgi:hypothetical protein
MFSDVAADDLFALPASDHQKLQDRIPVQFGDSLHTANTGTFQEHPKRKDRLFHRHGHFTERLFVRFSVRLPALAATKPAKTIAVFAEAGAPDIAVLAVHGYLRFGCRFHVSILQETIAVFKR